MWASNFLRRKICGFKRLVLGISASTIVTIWAENFLPELIHGPRFSIILISMKNKHHFLYNTTGNLRHTPGCA